MADKLLSELTKGTWDSATAYTPGDIVDNDGSSYICIENNTNQEPPSATYWAMLAEKGDQGIQGDAGEEVELQVSGGYIQWKYTSDVSWTNLIAVATLKGDKGDTGDTGAAGAEVELQKTATHIQWRYVGDVSWTNLVALSDITGPTGAPGAAGADGSDGKTVLSGNVAPTTEGVDGDFYINTTTSEIYGPKTGGAWGDPTSLVGPTGPEGPAGPGSGDVIGPATNSDNYLPQWNGTNTKTLKNGVAIPAGGLAGLTALADKVDKVTGKGLSTEDYTSAEKTKLSGIAEGANVGVVPNGAITGATKTKITYDAKGLVTAGADATTADIADSTDKRYVTDAEKTVIGNTSGTNTGDQDLSSLALKSNVLELDNTTPFTPDADYEPATKKYVDDNAGSAFQTENLLKNGNFINNSTNGYGSTPDDWTNATANPVQGGFPSLTKQELINLLGISDGDIEGLWNLNGTLNDLSSNGYNLTASASAPTDSSDGLMAQTKSFARASSQYASGTAANCNITASKTFFAFIKPGTLAASASHVIMSIDKLSSRGSSLYLYDNKLYFYNNSLGTTEQIGADIVFEANKWYFLCGVVDITNSKVKIWVNGIKKEAACSGSTHSTTANFAIGCNFVGAGDTAGDFFNGAIQNVGVLSLALTDSQVKKLFAATLYRGQKIRLSASEAKLYQLLPPDLVERLRGKTVTLSAKMYQEVASTGAIVISDTTSTQIDPVLTTGSWVDVSLTKTIAANATSVEININVNSSNGNVWFREIRLNESPVSLPYSHSKDDWSRFPRLLRMDIPAVINGYSFEEKRWFDWTPVYTGFTATVPTGGSRKYMIEGKTCYLQHKYVNSGISNAATLTLTAPVVIKNLDWNMGFISVYDNTANQAAIGVLENQTANGTVIHAWKGYYQTAWTASGSKVFHCPMFSYEID